MARPLRKTHPDPPLYIGSGQSGGSSGDNGVITGDLYVAGEATIVGTTTSEDFVLDASTGGVPGVGVFSVEVMDEGASLTPDATSLNFVGAGVTATAVSGAVTVTIAADPAWTEAVADARYVAKAGDTMTGALAGTSASFSGIVTSTGGQFVAATFGTNSGGTALTLANGGTTVATLTPSSATFPAAGTFAGNITAPDFVLA